MIEGGGHLYKNENTSFLFNKITYVATLRSHQYEVNQISLRNNIERMKWIGSVRIGLDNKNKNKNDTLRLYSSREVEKERQDRQE